MLLRVAYLAVTNAFAALRLSVRENLSWGYHKVHSECDTLSVKVAASTVWEILKTEGCGDRYVRRDTA